jgi:hypothetical protein
MISTPLLVLSPPQLDLLRHMLGINDPWMRVPTPYRDYAAVCPGDPEWVELERLGAIECYRRADGIGGSLFDWYCTTPLGRAAAMRSHRTIRKSRGKRVYSAWRGLLDCFPDLTFREFLKDPQFREVRRSA